MFSLVTRAFKFSLVRNPLLNWKSLTGFASLATSLIIHKSDTPAILERKPDALLVKQWWSQTPFDSKKPLIIPVFSFQTGEYAGENIELPHDIFNLPLRRDIVHNVYQWRRFLYRKTTHVQKTKGEVAGSGKKPYAQKGTGRARAGNKRANTRWKGGAAHGAKPRDYSYSMPKKIRLLALKTLLSAKLAEGKLRIVDSEQISEPKTKLVAKIVKQFEDKCQLLVVTAYKTDPNFKIAQENIPNIHVAQPHNLNMIKLLTADKVLITKEGLEQLIQNLRDRTQLNFQVGRKYNRELLPSELQRIEAFNLKTKKEMPQYDPTKPLQFKFKILEEYLKDYEKAKQKGAEPIDIKSDK